MCRIACSSRELAGFKPRTGQREPGFALIRRARHKRLKDADRSLRLTGLKQRTRIVAKHTSITWMGRHRATQMRQCSLRFAAREKQQCKVVGNRWVLRAHVNRVAERALREMQIARMRSQCRGLAKRRDVRLIKTRLAE